MARTVRYHEMANKHGWPMFSSTQTDNRFALCKKALCPDRSLLVRLKDCYPSELETQASLISWTAPRKMEREGIM